MCFYFILSLYYSICLGILAAHTGVTPSGDTYICLPNGKICPTANFGNNNSIDPRIVTPNCLCPPGFFPCFGIDTRCGERYVRNVNLNDGRADLGSHPWQAYLRNTTHVFSGSGVLLDSWHILTVAHKVAENRRTPEAITVYMGVWDPTNLNNTQCSNVEEIVLHPSYNSGTLINDIAILRLEDPIVLGVQDNINTLCLPACDTSFIGTNCMVAGWGQTSFISFDAPTVPQKQVSVNVVDPNVCRDSFARPSLLGSNVDIYLDEVGEICAGGEPMKDACTQDGGSPLECPDAAGFLNVAGLVIWGKNCGQPGVFGVYINVSYYSNWISTTIESINARYARK